VDITPSSLVVILKETNMHDFLWCVSSNWIKRTKGNCSCTIAQLHNCIWHIIAISHKYCSCTREYNWFYFTEYCSCTREYNWFYFTEYYSCTREYNWFRSHIASYQYHAQKSTIGSDHTLHPISIMLASRKGIPWNKVQSPGNSLKGKGHLNSATIRTMFVFFQCCNLSISHTIGKKRNFIFIRFHHPHKNSIH
jgi:hypothetical protein